ncbi:MAG: type II secretion system minor pseudopilin GspK [Hyphomonas sp.]
MSGSKPGRDEGATLLTTLFIVMAMSAAAFGAMRVVTNSVRTVKAMDEGLNIQWLARSAAIGGEAILRARDGAEALLFDAPVDIPLPAGPARVEFREATNCFNLNSLAADREGMEIDRGAFAAYQKFLVASGVTETDAEGLASTLADWIDADSSSRNSGAEDVLYMNRNVPHYAANRPLKSATELRAVEGYAPDLVRVLRAKVCAGTPAQMSVINVNALQPADAPLLYAVAPEWVGWNDITTAIEARPVGGWASAEDFAALFRPSDDGLATTFRATLVTAPAVIEARFVLSDRIGPVMYKATYEHAREGGWSLASLERSSE